MMRAGSAVRRCFTRSTGGASPALDLNFLSGTLPSAVTFTRASSATDGLYTDAAGTSFNTFSTNVARMLTSGLLIEEARTNQLLNSAVPVTQTTASLATGTYVFWCIGTGSVTSSAGTATASGLGSITGSQGTFQTISVTVAGTLTFTKTGSIDRFQLELGAFPTSFISTAGATATRAMDAASVAVSGFAYNSAASSIVANFVRGTTNAAQIQRIVSLDDASTNNFVSVAMNGTSFERDITAAGSAIVNGVLAGTPLAVGAVQKAAYGWQVSSAAFAANGAAVGTDTPASLPSGVTTLRLGSLAALTGQTLNGWLQRVRYFNQRLPNAQLQALAT